MCSCLDTDIDPLKVMLHLTFVILFNVSYRLVACIARIVKTVSLLFLSFFLTLTRCSIQKVNSKQSVSC